MSYSLFKMIHIQIVYLFKNIAEDTYMMFLGTLHLFTHENWLKFTKSYARILQKIAARGRLRRWRCKWEMNSAFGFFNKRARGAEVRSGGS